MPAMTYPVGDWLAYNQDRVWGTWITNNTCTGSTNSALYVTPTATAANTLIWNNWCAVTPVGSAQTVYVTTGTGTLPTWGQWTSTYAPPPAGQTPPLPYVVHEPTPEELAERQRQQAERVRRHAERAREQAQADARAEALLRSHLSEEQAAEYEREHVFHVRSRSGRLYRVQRGWSGNVFEVREEEEGRRVEVASYCIHPRESVPYADNMLAQALLLQDDEDDFRRIANRTLLRRAG